MVIVADNQAVAGWQESYAGGIGRFFEGKLAPFFVEIPYFYNLRAAGDYNSGVERVEIMYFIRVSPELQESFCVDLLFVEGDILYQYIFGLCDGVDLVGYCMYFIENILILLRCYQLYLFVIDSQCLIIACCKDMFFDSNAIGNDRVHDV